MSLTDLKRKKTKDTRKKVSVDDFIEDANNYALGKTAGQTAPSQTTAQFLKGLDKKSTKIYRHATFTLTEKSISQLDEIAKTTKVAKSKILRVLIDEFYQQHDNDQLTILSKSSR
ncbi:replication protein RepA [Shewanella ulleungensis]|uniref:Replication protein RepA n=1 Tax=Shewanella ulleungensis TaxID=2282699 RepID=A0ABQ2QRX8_9GAMM|nr:replication protein RepA [Shewanella ulleungensis]MCL1151437.1 replication protein RepA [Shewanella ulleungensis]GGP90932.1 replication protein RepA [Shewanella ulleungensis]